MFGSKSRVPGDIAIIASNEPFYQCKKVNVEELRENGHRKREGRGDAMENGEWKMMVHDIGMIKKEYRPQRHSIVPLPHSSALTKPRYCAMIASGEVVIVPTISMFYGITIHMQSERGGKHHGPHIHVRYQDDELVMGLDGQI